MLPGWKQLDVYHHRQRVDDDSLEGLFRYPSRLTHTSIHASLGSSGVYTYLTSIIVGPDRIRRVVDVQVHHRPHRADGQPTVLAPASSQLVCTYDPPCIFFVNSLSEALTETVLSSF
jgi:hypothetical protein